MYKEESRASVSREWLPFHPIRSVLYVPLIDGDDEFSLTYLAAYMIFIYNNPEILNLELGFLVDDNNHLLLLPHNLLRMQKKEEGPTSSKKIAQRVSNKTRLGTACVLGVIVVVVTLVGFEWISVHYVDVVKINISFLKK